MKWNMLLGAVVVSMGLCSQSFGFDLLSRMLNRGHGCCQTQCCETSCCEPTCCEPACCEPACCEPACEPACGEQSCCDSCNSCCRPKLCLFGRLKGLFDCHRCGKQSCCEPACGEQACCEPACAEPACCEQSCCDPCNSCCKRKRCGFLANLFKKHRCKSSCCNSCSGGCDSCNGGHGDEAAPAPAAGEAAPMPPAPVADPSASIQGRRSIVHASRKLVQRN